jgi:Tol biopolymer transport system component
MSSHRRRLGPWPRLAFTALAVLVLTPLPADAQLVELVSRAGFNFDSVGGDVSTEAISDDGRFVAFRSGATNLVPGQVDFNGNTDVFVYDRQLGTVSLVSHREGAPLVAAAGTSSEPVMSGDGRFVAFVSDAEDLVPGFVDTKPDFFTDVFLYEIATGIVTLASRSLTSPVHATSGFGAYGPAISNDDIVEGVSVAFVTDSTGMTTIPDLNGVEDVFVFRHALGTVHLASHDGVTAGDGASGAPSISDDGGRVAFQSLATNFAPLDLNGTWDVFVYNRVGDFVMQVSHDPSGVQMGNDWSMGPMISGDGTRIAFSSAATDLVFGFISGGAAHDTYGWSGGSTVLLSRTAASAFTGGNAWSSPNGVSYDGQTVAFRSLASDLTSGTDANGTVDVFLYDYGIPGVRLVSHLPGLPNDTGNGTSDLPTLSGDGAWVAFRSDADDLVAGMSASVQRHIFRYDRLMDTINLASHVPGDPLLGGDRSSWVGAVSNGGYVAVQSEATDLVPLLIYGANNVYMFPGGGGDLSLVSRAATPSSTPVEESYADVRSISADGRYVVFTSKAPNVVPGSDDQNQDSDVFVYDRMTTTVRMVSHAWSSTTTAADNFSGNPRISRNGTHVVFESRAIDLVNGFDVPSWTGDANLYLYDIATEAVTLLSHAAGSPLVPADGWSGEAVLSDDGRYIAFESTTTNLVPGFVDGNAGSDIFRYDRLGGPTTILVSRIDGSPTTSPSSPSVRCRISGDGASVTFETASPAGQLVAGAVDANGAKDVFLFEAPLVRLVSHSIASPLLAANGASTGGEIARNGSAVAFVSDADDVIAGIDANAGATDVFIAGTTMLLIDLVSHTFGDPANTANRGSWGPSISDDGLYVAFESEATDLMWGFVEGNGTAETDVFLYSGLTLANVLASHVPDDEGRGGNKSSYGARLSGDGARLAFSSDATDLAVGTDVNSALVDPVFPRPDVFLFERATRGLTLVSHSMGSLIDTANGHSVGDDISLGGVFVAFTSPANDLVADDYNSSPGQLPPIPSSGDVFLHTLSCSPVTLLSATPNGDNRIDLTWDSATPQTYWVLRSLTPGGPYSQIGSTDATTFADLTAAGGVTYYYVIGSPCGISNELATATTGSCGDAPEWPGPPSASTTPGACEVTLNWPAAVAPCGGGVTYSVYRSTDPLFVPDRTNRILASHPGTFHLDSFSIVPDTAYYYIIRATSLTTGVEDSNLDRVWQTPTGCLPAAPATVQFFNVRSYDGENTLEWVNPGGGYQETQIFFTDDGSPPFCATATPVPGSPFVGTAGTRDRAVHSGLTNGTLYQYTACVHDGVSLSWQESPSLGRPDAVAGSVKWGYTTDATTLATAGVSPDRGYFVVSNDTVLHGLTPRSDGGLWPLGPPEWYPSIVGPVQNRPTVLFLDTTTVKGASKVLLVGSQDGHVYAVDAESGRLLWTSPQLGTWVQASPSAMLKDLGGAYDLVLVGTRDGGADNTFYGLHLSDGTIAWSFDNGGPGSGIGIISGQAQVDYANNRVYFTSYTRGGGSSSTVWCLDFTDTGAAKLWEKGTVDGIANTAAGPVLAFGTRLYVGTEDGVIHALHPDDGSPLWLAPWPTGDTFVKGYVWPDFASNRLYFSTTNFVHAIQDNGGTVSNFWTAPVSITAPSPPVLLNGRVYVGGANNRVYSIDATSMTPAVPTERIVGDPAWGDTIGPPTLDTTNNLLLLGSEGGIVYSVEPF